MGSVSILLIEDDLNVFHGIQRRLQASGYEIFYAPDAVASISQARQHRPSLILLDLGLPAGDGFVVMERLRQFSELATIPVVVLSGRDRAANEMRALRAGAAAYLQKPVSVEVLLATIRKCLRLPTAPKAPMTYSVGTSSVGAQNAGALGADAEMQVYERAEYAQNR
jgi:two-component system KDP operon response regulator KdpE